MMKLFRNKIGTMRKSVTSSDSNLKRTKKGLEIDDFFRKRSKKASQLRQPRHSSFDIQNTTDRLKNLVSILQIIILHIDCVSNINHIP